ncbi:uncharacterized protein LOC129728067 isoform X2 [Wyeomyia smithii]|nr:uncharacterized protein LOC129728067 isoform X2 [Wyeomyia smithii]
MDFNGQQPNVVGFGGLNVDDYDDPEDIKQFAIVNVTRFPKYNIKSSNHDIALLRLDRNVTINSTAIPTCLWTEKEFRFKTLETAFWAQEQRPLRVSFRTTKLSKCCTNQTDSMSEHVCVLVENDEKCEIHAGAPLQTRLMHNGRITPFLVGISSDGLDCGASATVAYTKVSNYYAWIVTAMQSYGIPVNEATYNSTSCALRFVMFRDYEDPIIMHKSNSSVSINLGHRSKSLEDQLPSYVVQLAWHTKEARNCHGIIIDESTVVTLADCVHHDGFPVTHVVLSKNVRINVSSVHIHPDFENGSAYNNIAVLDLEKFIDISQFQPVCIWHDNTIPYEKANIFGFGRADINAFWPDESDETPGYLKVQLKVQNASTCLVPDSFSASLKNGLGTEHICLGKDFFLVPDSCQLVHGGAIDESMFRSGNVYPTTYGLVQYGPDCGFGEHAIATSLASYVAWMESLLLPKRSEGNAALQFIDTSLIEGDPCTLSGELLGICVHVSKCSRMWFQLLPTDSFLLCSSSSVVCCPFDHVRKNESIHPDIANCPETVQSLMPNSRNGSMVRLGWLVEDSLEFRCIGTIITNSVILTTASCLGSVTPDWVELVANVSEVRYEVSCMVIHPGYNSSEDNINDLALVKLHNTLEWSSQVFPSCLWTKETHTPVELRMVYSEETGKIQSSLVLAMYNSDCQRTHINKVLGTQICARDRGSNSTCVSTHSQLMWYRNDGVQFVVGSAVDAPDCRDWYYMMFTRISSFTNWIAQNV